MTNVPSSFTCKPWCRPCFSIQLLCSVWRYSKTSCESGCTYCAFPGVVDDDDDDKGRRADDSDLRTGRKWEPRNMIPKCQVVLRLQAAACSMCAIHIHRHVGMRRQHGNTTSDSAINTCSYIRTIIDYRYR